MFDTIELFVKHSELLVLKAKSNTTYSKDVKFLMINGIGYANKHIQNSLSGLVSCSVQKTKELADIITLLLYSSIAILALFFVYL